MGACHRLCQKSQCGGRPVTVLKFSVRGHCRKCVNIKYIAKNTKLFFIITFMVTKSVWTGYLWSLRRAGKARWGRPCITTSIIVFWWIATVLGVLTWWPITIAT
jgi:hypothetical protein